MPNAPRAANASGAPAVLESLNPLTRAIIARDTPENDVAFQLAEALRERGSLWTSSWPVALSLRSRGAHARRASLLRRHHVDTDAHYANPNVAERCVTRPEILRAFGWRVLIVLTRDWYHEPQAVLDRLARAARGEASLAEEATEDDTPPVEEVTVAPRPAVAPLPEPPTSMSVPGAAETNLRRFEMVEGGHSKFWEIAQDNLTVLVRYGRIGSTGQVLTKTFDTLPRANREVEKLTAEKLRKGYREAPK